KVQGPASVTPFLLLGDDTQPATPGFQGNFRAGVAFVQQPTGAAAGRALTPPVTVRVFDIFGNPVTAGSSSITVALGPNPAGAPWSRGARAPTAAGPAGRLLPTQGPPPTSPGRRSGWAFPWTTWPGVPQALAPRPSGRTSPSPLRRSCVQ